MLIVEKNEELYHEEVRSAVRMAVLEPPDEDGESRVSGGEDILIQHLSALSSFTSDEDGLLATCVHDEQGT